MCTRIPVSLRIILVPRCGALRRSVALSREKPHMSQHAGSADDESIQLTYSSLPPGKRSRTPPHARRGPAPGGPGPVRASRGAWPHSHHRLLNAASLGALFALGVLLGTVVSGD